MYKPNILKRIRDTIFSWLYPEPAYRQEPIKQFFSGTYRTNAGIPWKPLFPIVDSQRTLHQWDWATNAPEKGVPIYCRNTSVVQTCMLCNTTSMLSHTAPHVRYLVGYAPLFVPQPICPETCQDTTELMSSSPLSTEEKHRLHDTWNKAYRDVDSYFPKQGQTQ